jgi:hypothetical protein
MKRIPLWRPKDVRSLIRPCIAIGVTFIYYCNIRTTTSEFVLLLAAITATCCLVRSSLHKLSGAPIIIMHTEMKISAPGNRPHLEVVSGIELLFPRPAKGKIPLPAKNELQDNYFYVIKAMSTVDSWQILALKSQGKHLVFISSDL